jgi:hypothetical protein
MWTGVDGVRPIIWVIFGSGFGVPDELGLDAGEKATITAALSPAM